MSDIIPPDAAIAEINARIGLLNAEIGRHVQAAQVATAIRDELADLAAMLGRKARIRKPRAVTEVASDAADDALRPTVFAAPCVGDVPGEAA
jgi:hypothetical protein